MGPQNGLGLWGVGARAEPVLSLGSTPGQTSRGPPLLVPGLQEVGGWLWRDEVRALGPSLVESRVPVSPDASPSHADPPGPGRAAE